MNASQTQNSLLLKNLMNFYNKDDNLHQMLTIINGDSSISLRIVDWFVTNYSKQYYITYTTETDARFKVYVDYKLKLRAYSKKGLILFVDGTVSVFHIMTDNTFKLL